jgi:hypothetical protein
MSPCREDSKPVLARDSSYGASQLTQLDGSIGHLEMRERCNLDLGLQEFSRNPTSGCGLGGLKEHFRHARGNGLRLGVHQEIFFFDPEFEV